MFAALAKKDLFEGLLQKFRFTSRSVFICLVGEMLNDEGEMDSGEAEGSSSTGETISRVTNGSTDEALLGGVATSAPAEAKVIGIRLEFHAMPMNPIMLRTCS